ncbi:hypothetical protein [Streptomyces sp. SBT349]|uniref:hypothetical protein n=1 Tax=Streptomyces sp. SBT349 TaxID=1580539 RepID=UPI00069FC101
MHQATAQFKKWVSVSHPAPQSKVRLACFPYAGGSARFSFPVSKALHPSAALRHLDDKPLAPFGHSMRAVLA